MNLREECKKAISTGISIRFLARKIEYDNSALSKWLRGEKNISEEAQNKLILALQDLKKQWNDIEVQRSKKYFSVKEMEILISLYYLSYEEVNELKIKNQFTIRTSENVRWCDYIELVDACRALNGSALKLFIYFSSLGPNQEFNFFPKIFCERYGVSMSSEKNAFSELLQEGYLKQIEPDFYLFTTNKN